MGIKAKTVWLKHFVNEGVPQVEDFEIVESNVDENDLGDGQVLVEVAFMSVDPYLRGGLKANGSKESGRKVLEGFVSGIVLQSNNEKWEKGDFFGGNLPFSTAQIVPAARAAGMWKLTGLVEESKLSYGIGVLGMPGSTAYGGITGILRPEKEGETILISAASGAVGSLAGQIAKNVYKLNVVGTCGGKTKCDLITEKFGYDGAVDYRSIDTSVSDGGAAELAKKLKEFAPEGIDMYFENVGGFHFDAAFSSLRPGGRIAVCGVISQYNSAVVEPSKVNLAQMIYTNQRIEGFVCFPWLSGQKGHFLKDMSQWLKDGLISDVEETFYDGVESWPEAFQSLFLNSSRNKGKVVVRI